MNPPWIYYYIQAPAGHEDITLTTVTEVGNINLYSKKCSEASLYACSLKNHLPNETNYQYTTRGSALPHLSIPRNDGTSVSLYVIGVQSMSYFASFQISLRFTNTILTLLSGVPVLDHVNKNEIDFFSYYLNEGNVALKIQLTPVSAMKKYL